MLDEKTVAVPEFGMTKNPKTNIKRVLICLFLILPVGPVQAKPSTIVTPKPAVDRIADNTPTKSEILNHLKNLQKRHHDEIFKLEKQIKNLLRDSATIRLENDNKFKDKSAEKIASRIAELEKKRAELIARRSFIDRLILAIDSRWDGENLKQFLEHQLLDMATADLTNPEGPSSIWKFILYASIVVREIPERNENPISILENYMESTAVLDPKPPAEFAAGRHYTNGSQSYTATPGDREKLGEYLESRLKQLKLPAASSEPKVESAAPADIEIRLRPSNPIPFEAEESETRPEPKIIY